MNILTVDHDLCKKDGICVAECPGQLISMENEFPEMKRENEEFCIDCGHCVAVCNSAALSLQTLKPEDCLPMNKELKLSEEHVEHFLRSRRSIRSYKDKPVDRIILEKIIEIAGYAPTASNKQPVKWLIINEKEDVSKIAGMVIAWMKHMIEEMPDLATEMRLPRIVSHYEAGTDRICRGAPHLIFTYAENIHSYAATDCATALGYLELAMPSFDLGGCWAGYVNFVANAWPPLIEMLGLPKGHKTHGAMMVGYPKYRYHRMPLRNKRSIVWK
ncbi:nitroreductase family protein [bacterium]|nr:nitroreductase family protein [bacterium]